MKGDEIIDIIIKYIEQNNIVVDETLSRRRRLIDLFCVSKCKVQSDFIVRGITPTGKNFLTSVIDATNYEKGSEFNYFELSPAVMNVYNYVSALNGCELRMCQYETDLHNSLHLQVAPQVLCIKEREFLKVKDSIIETIKVNFIPENPMKMRTFNFDFDDFPVDSALIDTILTEMFKTYQSKVEGKTKDKISDSTKTNS